MERVRQTTDAVYEDLPLEQRPFVSGSRVRNAPIA